MENIRYTGRLRRLDDETINSRAGKYLELFDMSRFTERLAGRLSGGMKQKLALVCTLITEPQVLLLDEPTTGVDPVSRREFWDVLAGLADGGMTILVATPYLDEAERCSRVALIYQGQIIETGTPRELRDNLGLTRLEVRADQLGKIEVLLDHAEFARDVQRFGDRLDVMVKNPESAEQSIKEMCAANAVGSVEIAPSAPTLENTFVSILRKLEPPKTNIEFPYQADKFLANKNGSAIESKNLRKKFGDFEAVKSINLEIGYGEIYGLLGANGAGKTTTIKMLCGLAEPSSGSISLGGETNLIRSAKVRRRIGYMSQKFSLYDDLTVGENLDFFAGVYGVPREERKSKKKWVLSFAGLDGKENTLTGSLPGGWKQRVAFGSSIMHEPEILFLDEPTSGVDPIARRAFWRIINQLADHGVAILVTTHYLEEAEQCNRLGLMVAGELVAEGTPTSVKDEQEGTLIEISVENPQKTSDALKKIMQSWQVSIFGDRLHVIVEQEYGDGLETLRNYLTDFGINILKAERKNYSLEDVFISVVEKARRQGKAAEEE